MGWLARVLGARDEDEPAVVCRCCGRPCDVTGLVCIRTCEACVTGGDAETEGPT
jgi:hypothetical protein